MRITVVCITVALVVAASIAAPLKAGEVTVTYRFGEPRVVRTDRGFELIEFPATIQGGRPGEPSYPFRGAAILLPPGEAAADVSIARRGWTRLGGTYRLHPMQPPTPGQGSDPRGRTFLYREEVYAVDRWMQPPDSKFTTRYCRGHAIAVGSFSPVRYHPLNGEVGYYREVSVTIETAPGAASTRSLALLRTDDDSRARLEDLVDNPGDLVLYGGMGHTLGPTGDTYEYMIITRDSLSGAFIPFRDFYTRRGLRAKIKSVEEIEAGFSGGDTAERIRNAIKYEYTNHGITHVLLAGDANGAPAVAKIVPYRGLRCAVQSRPSLYEDDNLPADLYFAALDGDWNTDGDALWGEPGEEDFYSEISVGRACVSTTAEVARFVNKNILYQESPVAGGVRRALMLGEKLWNDPLTYGADEMDQLVGTCAEHGFTTTGIPTDFDTTTHYDRDGPVWNKSVVWTDISAGTHWVNHSGHCNQSYALRLNLSDITNVNFTNDGVSANFAIIYSYGCYAASFDNRSSADYLSTDCIAEKMLNIDHCAVVFFGNSRYGWFTEGTTNGPSHHFQREFYDAVFTEGYHELGEANQRSKDETVPFIDLPDEYEPGAHRWCFYTLNLLGDPALDPWTGTPCSLTVSHPALMGRYDNTIELTAPGVPGARATLYHDGVCYGLGVGSPVGYIVLERLLPFPDSISAIELNVSAHNHYTYRDTIGIDGLAGVEKSPPRIALAQNTPNPFNPSTVIRFTLDREGSVDLRVYDVAGREVDRLVRGPLPAGTHAVTWRPVHLPSGVYLYVLRAGEQRLSRKAVLLR
ncbi:MAG TPA: C25 family cysteine peptidase [Patescibacteria group bacterium]|nr:C25 family cysteine peptidase [Patescibacteria group bacterium]